MPNVLSTPVDKLKSYDIAWNAPLGDYEEFVRKYGIETLIKIVDDIYGCTILHWLVGDARPDDWRKKLDILVGKMRQSYSQGFRQRRSICLNCSLRQRE